MANDMRFRWDGLDELRWHLQHLPEELTGFAQDTVRQAANRAAQRITHRYPVSGVRKRTRERVSSTGRRLAASVTVKEDLSHYGARAIVQSRAPHAHLWEWGTGQRRTAKGWNRGAMRPSTYGAPVFVPIVEEERAWMYARMIEQLRHAGVELEVQVA